MFDRYFRLLLSPEAGEGGGTNTEPPEGDNPAKVVEALNGLIKKHGDAQAVALVLLSENHSYREKLRDAKAKLPADGSLVLTADDAKAWAAYRQLGDPAALGKLRDEHAAFGSELAEFRREKRAAEIAELYGWKPAVLSRLLADTPVEIVEANGQDGKPTKKAVVKGDGDKPIDLSEHLSEFLPALRAEPERRGSGLGNSTRPVVPATPSQDGPPSLETQLRADGYARF